MSVAFFCSAQNYCNRNDFFIVGIHQIKQPKVIVSKDTVSGKSLYYIIGKNDSIKNDHGNSLNNYLYLHSAFLSGLLWSDKNYKTTYNYSLFDNLYKRCIEYEKKHCQKECIGEIKTEKFVLFFVSSDLLKWQFTNTNFNVKNLPNSGYVACLTPLE